MKLWHEDWPGLTAEQLEMAALAGASGRDDLADGTGRLFGDQLDPDPDVPRAGDTYRNEHTGYICTVTGVRRSRGLIVEYRNNGSPSSVPLATFLRVWKPCRGNGTYR